MAIRFDRTALRRLRRRAGLSVTETAERAGLSRQAVSILERARGAPRADNLAKLAQALGVAVTDFYVNGS